MCNIKKMNTFFPVSTEKTGSICPPFNPPPPMDAHGINYEINNDYIFFNKI